eukprot:scaffold4986_cov63-Phaeocystis_antarctica.AAC.1
MDASFDMITVHLPSMMPPLCPVSASPLPPHYLLSAPIYLLTAPYLPPLCPLSAPSRYTPS